MTTNIVATITGNGAALTAEINKTFGAIPGMAKNVGRELGNLFDTEFEKGARKAETVARASAQSISEIVRNATVTNGAVQFDSAGIKATISARNQELQVMEALLLAKQRLVAKDSDATRESQVYLATLRQTVNEERQAIAALTSKAQVLDNLQAELGATAVQQARVNATSGQARAGMQQLGFQISDVSQSFASGVSPMVIFGQQASQVVQAVGMMTTKTSGLVGFLLGPWGAAILAATTVLGTLYFAHDKTKDSTEKNERAQRSLTEVLADQKSTQEEVTKAIEEYNRAQQKSREITIDSLRLKESTISGNLKEAESERIKTKAVLEGAIARYKSNQSSEANPFSGGEMGRVRRTYDSNMIASLEKDLSSIDSKIANLRTAAKNVNIEVASERARLQTDRSAGIEDEYRRKELRLKREISDQDQLTAALVRNNEAKERALNADRDAKASNRAAARDAREAEKAQEALAASLKNVTSLFDPARQAAAEYRIQLQEIKKLENAGVADGGISAQDAKRYRDALADSHAAKLDAIENARHATFMGNMSREFQLAGELGGDVAAKMISDYLSTTQAAEAKIIELRQQDVDRQRREFEDLASFYERAFQSGGRSIWSDFKQMGRRALSELAAQATIKLLGGGSASGGGGLLSSLFQKGSGLDKIAGKVFGSGAGSAIMKAVPQIGAALTVNSMISSALGGDQVKNGKFFGMFAPFLTPLLGSALRGSATLGINNGELGVGATSGNSGKRIGAAKSGITAVGDLLNQIAEGVGGTITGAGSVSLGMRKKNYVVDTSGRGRTKGAGVLKFKDEQDAIEAAVRDALQDGVISGISAAAQSIIASGQDLQKAIQKAVMIESIPKALKARLNPVGAALEELNAKWDKTIAALKEGGASAAQMADAEKLYRLEREDAMKAANDNLKEFISSLNFGSSSTYSLTDQSKMARADLDKYLGNINAGNFGAVDQQKYLASAQAFLDIQRELSGSGTGWFNSVDELRNATQKLADGLEKGSSGAETRDPFAELTASSTQATAEILAQHSGFLVQQGQTLASIAQSLQNISVSGGFIGADRKFIMER